MQTRSSQGHWFENFDYGYPYTKTPPQFYNSPAFTYSDMSTGKYAAKANRTNEYTVQYQSPAQQPKSIDRGNHAGAKSGFPYYLMFPKLGWADRECLTIEFDMDPAVSSDKHCAIGWSMDWDMSGADHIYVILNGVLHDDLHGAAGNNWTRYTIELPSAKRRNTLNICLSTAPYNVPQGQGGTGENSSTSPDYKRYVRICDFEALSLTKNPEGRTAASSTGGSGTVAVGGGVMGVGQIHIDAQFTVAVESTGPRQNLAGPQEIVVECIVTVIGTQEILGICHILAESDSYIRGKVDHQEEVADGGFAIDGHAALSVIVPIDHRQTVQELIRPLQQVTLHMKTPVIIGGKPVLPSVPASSTSTFTTAQGYTLSAPPDPANTSGSPPFTPTYRWVSADLPGADQDPVDAWPNRVTGGPSWLSKGIYRPFQDIHDHYNRLEDVDVLYNRAVYFYSGYVQHMWLTLPAPAVNNQPYTWQFVGIIQRPTHTKVPRLLDAGKPTPDHSIDVIENRDIYLEQQRPSQSELVNNGRAYVAFRDGQVEMTGNNTKKPVRKPMPSFYKVPVVYTCTFNNGANSGIWIRGYGINQRYKMDIGSSNVDGFVLGRATNRVSDNYAFDGMLLDVLYYNSALTDAQIVQNSHYLGGLYRFNKYR